MCMSVFWSWSTAVHQNIVSFIFLNWLKNNFSIQLASCRTWNGAWSRTSPRAQSWLPWRESGRHTLPLPTSDDASILAGENISHRLTTSWWLTRRSHLSYWESLVWCLFTRWHHWFVYVQVLGRRTIFELAVFFSGITCPRKNCFWTKIYWIKIMTSRFWIIVYNDKQIIEI